MTSFLFSFLFSLFSCFFLDAVLDGFVLSLGALEFLEWFVFSSLLVLWKVLPTRTAYPRCRLPLSLYRNHQCEILYV
jgi:hypothetical protein